MIKAAKRLVRVTALMFAVWFLSGAAAQSIMCSPDAQGAQINYWNGFSGPDGAIMQQMVDRFNAENDQGIRVNMTIQPFTEYYTQINAAASSNTLPDVLQIHLDQLATNAARNIIMPIPEDVLAELGVDGSDFPETVWQGTEYNGQRYALPLDVHPLVMWYNREQWEAAGLEDPAGRILTAEEYDAALNALSEQGGDSIAWAVTTGFPITWMFEILLHQFGGSRFNEDATEATWNSEAGVQALTYLKEAQQQHSRPNLPVDAGITAFKQGNSATEWNGTWQVSNLTGEGYQAGWGAPIPNVGGNYVVTAGAHTLALGRQQTEDPARTAAAGCLIEYLTSNSLEWVQGGGHIPANNTVRNSPEFQALEPHASYALMAEHVIFPPLVPGITDALAPLGEAVEAVMAGQVNDIQGALDDAASRANQILEQNRRRYGSN